jgi:glycosyltransferase involved in cell wall biosynthesis
VLRSAGAGGAGRLGFSFLSWLSDWLRVPDSRIGWLVPAVWSGLRETRNCRPDVIYSTAPMWTAHLAAMCLSRLLDRPWVADCRDPWHANPYRCFRHAAHRRVDAWLESRMVARAAFVICNTTPAKDELASRYPASADRLVVIPNGYDAGEVQAVRRLRARRDKDVCRFVHAGSFYGPRSPMPLMGALGLLVRRRPRLRRRVRLCLLGPSCYDGASLAGLADRLGIGDIVEIAGPLPHSETLRRVDAASVAVVCSHSGPGSDLQIPGKFYEYMGLGKPTLVVGGACRAIRQLLGGRQVRYLWLAEDGPRGLRGLCETMEQIVSTWRAGRLGRRRRIGLDLSADRMAGRIEAVLEQPGRFPRPSAWQAPATVETQPC